ELAVSAAANGEVAVAFGGDGLIGAVAGALIGSDGLLGILPGGRGNDLCRVLGIPLKPVAACGVLASGVERDLDLGEANGRTVAAANSKQFGGGMRLAPNASLTDGLLDVVIIEDMSKPRFLRLAPTVFSGRHLRYREVHVVQGREIRIEATEPFTLYADGEAI